MSFFDQKNYMPPEIELHESPYDDALEYMYTREQENADQYAPERLFGRIEEPVIRTERARERTVELVNLMRELDTLLEKPLHLLHPEPELLKKRVGEWQLKQSETIRRLLCGSLNPQTEEWLLGNTDLRALLEDIGDSSEFFRWALNPDQHDRQAILNQPRATTFVDHFPDQREQYVTFTIAIDHYVPKLLRHYVKEINLTKYIKLEVEQYGKLVEATGEYHYPQKNSAPVVNVHRDFHDDEYQILRHLAHEIMGHGVDPRTNLFGKQHLLTLNESLEVMNEWQPIRSQTTAEVFPYVAGIDKPTEFATQWVRSLEDFAETMSYAYSDPEDFAEGEPERAAYAHKWLTQIFGEYQGRSER